MNKSQLPAPESNELRKLVSSGVPREIYAVLFNNQQKPLTIGEIGKLVKAESRQQANFSRRLRELDNAFKIERTKQGSKWFYRLISLAEKPRGSPKITKRLRAWVLRSQRCNQCGRTPAEDGVKLHVDHIIPDNWGGPTEEENLQPLCSDCNEGKKNLYSSYNAFSEQIKKAINHNEPHKRIGELLKVLKGKPVPSNLLEVVAKAQQYQEDWQKRLRELRELGWKYTVKRQKEGRRVKVYYILEHFEPWPPGKISSEIKKREQRKKLVK